ncbi:angiomotin-like isoform X2 [Mercenaria mercenaria]|uniref:angiomotin-like isoform X2 n=1 Tax=Mercenaria mercenaria TaxID=6596 RepID=UPI00234EF249|nr:angiomotin-like isoform X2 [Mercenaria mercenaria]
MVLETYTEDIEGIYRCSSQNELPSSLNSPEELYKEIHNMSGFPEPPPYPGPPKQITGQTGLHQSFSGSETSTDVSVSSTENLPTCHRQEPQGEETQLPQTCISYDTCGSSEYSILARLGMPTSGMEINPINTPQIYVTGNPSTVHGPHFATSPAQRCGSQTQNLYMSSESGFSSASTSSSKLTLGDNSNLNNSFTSGYSCDTSPNVPSRQSISNFSSPTSVSSYSSSTLYANFPCSVNTGVIDHYQLQQLPQFAMSPQPGQYLTSLPPPPEYPGAYDPREATRRSYEIIGKHEIPGSRSQPELSHFVATQNKHLGIVHTPAGSGSDRGSQQSLEGCVDQPRFSSDIDHIAAQATRMVDFLTEENKALRLKLSMYDHKVTKLQKFELEIQRVHEGYEALVKSNKKREQLEVAMKKRLEEDLKKVKAMNSGLIQQLQNAGISVPENVILASVEPTDSSMAHLLAKHKELLSVKERQDMEIEAQRSTIQEQRAQIEILRSVQANQLRMDEEAHRQQIIAEYDEQIQKELSSIKAAYEKKELTERSIRQKLEKDMEHCRQNHGQLIVKGRKADPKRDLNADIKKMLDEKEAKILQLEKELIQWKEQQLEESIRKIKLQEVETEAMPRLPAYEQTSTNLNNTETLIHEAKTEKLKQMEEIYQANRKVAELEANVKSLQSQLSEKEAMLRVYQRSPMTRSSSVHTIYCTPKHSPRPSLVATGSLSRQHSQDVSAFLDVKHKKTGSTSALESYSKMSQDELFEKIQGLQTTSKSNSDSEESSDIWQV